MNTKKGIFLATLGLLVFCAFIGTASGATIYVPDDYAKIQWAVDNASAGDTIIVRDGTYTENIDVNKPHLTIRSENGAASTIVQAANSNDDVIEVKADYVNISGFTIKGATTTEWQSAGIYLYYADYCKLSNNNISNNDYGISLRHSGDNTIVNNNVSSNKDGISLWCFSINSVIMDNSISNNTRGIWLDHSRSTTIINNNIVDNDIGIGLYNSSESIIMSNSVLDNGAVTMGGMHGDGIILEKSYKNMIKSNVVLNNGLCGICLQYFSENNTIIDNDISNNSDGVHLYNYSSGNVITNNNISINSNVGILFIDHSSKNKIYFNNFINDAHNVYSSNSTNIWNSTEKITYSYNGSEFEDYLGNHWDDYLGSDADGDGIGDTP